MLETNANASHTTRWWISAILATLLGLVLRGFAIDSQSFWYDEAVSSDIIMSSYGDILCGDAKDQGNPNAYLICAKAWSGLFGRTEIGFRSFSVVCGVLTIPLLGLLGCQLFNEDVGIMAAGLLAISPLEIELSNEARCYALLHLVAVGNTYFFVLWVRGERRIDLILYGATAALGWYTHYYAPALQLAQATSLAVLPHLRKRLFPWTGAMLGAILLWSPWLPAFVEQLRTPGNLERVPGESWLIQYFATPIAFGLGRTFAWRDSPYWMFGLAALVVMVTLLFPVALGIVRGPSQRFARVLLRHGS